MSPDLIPQLYRSEYRKLISVLSRAFGLERIEIAEDLVSDTFLLAAETWGLKGVPQNPTAWLYAVAKNRARDYLRRTTNFQSNIAQDLIARTAQTATPDIDWSDESINDSQLQMMFTICHPLLPEESQIGLCLSLLCGFSVDEIASAFLTNKEAVYKRLARAKEKWREAKIKIEQPSDEELENRLRTILTTLYLLFNEGYYSASQDIAIRKDLCGEGMRLTMMLLGNVRTNTPSANALLALMCFHASRFDARIDKEGATVLYDDQNTSLWDHELIGQGNHYLNLAAKGKSASRYHYEAAIAWWHTRPGNSTGKWHEILQLYNGLLILEYSPMAALNRTYALSKTAGNKAAIKEAEKLQLSDTLQYNLLLGHLYKTVDKNRAKEYLVLARQLAGSSSEIRTVENHIALLTNQS